MESDLLAGLQGGAGAGPGALAQPERGGQCRLGGRLVPGRRGAAAEAPPPAARHRDRRPGPHPRRAQERRRDRLRHHAGRADARLRGRAARHDALPLRGHRRGGAALPHAVGRTVTAPAAGAAGGHLQPQGRAAGHLPGAALRPASVPTTRATSHPRSMPSRPRSNSASAGAWCPSSTWPHGPALQELLPGATVDVMLYWQHWARESPSAQRLTRAVKEAAHVHLSAA